MHIYKNGLSIDHSPFMLLGTIELHYFALRGMFFLKTHLYLKKIPNMCFSSKNYSSIWHPRKARKKIEERLHQTISTFSSIFQYFRVFQQFSNLDHFRFSKNRSKWKSSNISNIFKTFPIIPISLNLTIISRSINNILMIYLI